MHERKFFEVCSFYSSVSYSHLFKRITVFSSLEHFWVNWFVHLEIIVRCDRKDLILTVLLGHGKNSLQGKQKYSKSKVIIDMLCICNCLDCLSCVSIQFVPCTLATLKAKKWRSKQVNIYKNHLRTSLHSLSHSY